MFWSDTNGEKQPYYQDCHDYAMFLCRRFCVVWRNILAISPVLWGEEPGSCLKSVMKTCHWLRKGFIAGDYLPEVEGMVIFLWVESLKLAVEEGVIHCRFVDNPAFIMDAGDVDYW